MTKRWVFIAPILCIILMWLCVAYSQAVGVYINPCGAC